VYFTFCHAAFAAEFALNSYRENGLLRKLVSLGKATTAVLLFCVVAAGFWDSDYPHYLGANHEASVVTVVPTSLGAQKTLFSGSRILRILRAS
jgi:hypothetical protein